MGENSRGERELVKRGDTEPERVLTLHKAGFSELCPRVMEFVRALD